MSATLRPYQDGLIVQTWAAMGQGFRRILDKSPTGTGKTVTFAAIPRRPEFMEWMAQFPKRGAQMLVIAHREELIDQAAEKIRAQNPGLMVAVEQGDRFASRYADVVVASIQTLSAMKYRRLKRLLEFHAFRVVIVDEAHHASANTYRTTLVLLGFLPPAEASDEESLEAPSYEDVLEMEKALEGWDQVAPKDRVLIGVTATPNRSDEIGLGCVFQTIAFEYALKDAIADGWLVKILPWVIETDVSLDGVKLSHGDFNQKQLAKAVNNARRNELALAAWKEHAQGVQALAFTVDVDHAHAMAEVFTAGGVRAKALSGKTPSDERRRSIEDFRQGRIDVIMNCALFTEGTDLPMCGCIIHGAPTKSATLYEQKTGRGLRLYPGKEHCIVIDLVDVARRHTLQAAPTLYGLPPSLKVTGEELAQVAAEYDELAQKYPGLTIGEGQHKTLAQLRARASTFDLWSVPALGDFGDGRTLNWIKMADEDYRVSYPWADGEETIAVQRDMLGAWTVSLTLRPKNGDPIRQMTIGARLKDARKAAVVAETFVYAQRRSAMRLSDKDALWRQKPMSFEQSQLLARLGVQYKPGLRCGEASDLITRAKTMRGLR